MSLTRPLEMSLYLGNLYVPDLVSGKITDAELKKLVTSFTSKGNRATNPMSADHYTKDELIQNFVLHVCAPHLTQDQLNALNRRLLPIEGKTLSSEPTLLKHLLALQANKAGFEHLYASLLQLIEVAFQGKQTNGPVVMDFLRFDMNHPSVYAFMHSIVIPVPIMDLYKQGNLDGAWIFNNVVVTAIKHYLELSAMANKSDQALPHQVKSVITYLNSDKRLDKHCSRQVYDFLQSPRQSQRLVRANEVYSPFLFSPDRKSQPLNPPQRVDNSVEKKKGPSV